MLKVWKILKVRPVEDVQLRIAQVPGSFPDASVRLVTAGAHRLMREPGFNTITKPAELKIGRVELKELGFTRDRRFTLQEVWGKITYLGGDYCPPELAFPLLEELNDSSQCPMELVMQPIRLGQHRWILGFYPGYRFNVELDPVDVDRVPELGGRKFIYVIP
jgi:hypothetical protein